MDEDMWYTVREALTRMLSPEHVDQWTVVWEGARQWSDLDLECFLVEVYGWDRTVAWTQVDIWWDLIVEASKPLERRLRRRHLSSVP